MQAESETFEAIHAETNATDVAAIAAYTNHQQGVGAALYAESRSPRTLREFVIRARARKASRDGAGRER